MWLAKSCSLFTVLSSRKAHAVCAHGSWLARCCVRKDTYVWQLKETMLRYVIINIRSTKNQSFPHFTGLLRPVDVSDSHLHLLTDLCAATFPVSGGHVCIFDIPVFFPLPFLSHITSCHLLHSLKSISRRHPLEQFPLSDTIWTIESLKSQFRMSDIWVCQASDGPSDSHEDLRSLRGRIPASIWKSQRSLLALKAPKNWTLIKQF